MALRLPQVARQPSLPPKWLENFTAMILHKNRGPPNDPMLQRIGKQAAAAYRRTHDRNPYQTSRWVSRLGRTTQVNVYTEQDRDMIERIVDRALDEEYGDACTGEKKTDANIKPEKATKKVVKDSCDQEAKVAKEKAKAEAKAAKDEAKAQAKAAKDEANAEAKAAKVKAQAEEKAAVKRAAEEALTNDAIEVAKKKRRKLGRDLRGMWRPGTNAS